MAKILIIDDEPNLRRVLALNLRQQRHEVAECPGVITARQRLREEVFDIVFTDQKMPDGEGLEVLAAALESDPSTSVIFITAFATVELAVDAMRQGAFDFITKPFQRGMVLAIAERAAERTRLLRENRHLKETVVRLEGSPEILGSSPGIRKVKQLIQRVAQTAAIVLITGETGTGKEIAARAIHRQSPRAARAFVPVNCAAFAESLLENELFGHEKGAFTGADRPHAGLFEAADGGTLFLDEIAELSAAAQAKLLRVLTDGAVLRLGSTQPRKVDVRLLAATHRDLQQRVREGLFREDLYYRLAVVPLAIPPLRERAEDIPLLCEFFLRQAAADLKTPLRRLSPQAMARLRGYAFPGNVRELRNLIEHALILAAGDPIEADSIPLPETPLRGAAPPAGREDLTDWLQQLPEVHNLKGFMAGVEREVILRALKTSGGAQAEAARQLGVSRSDLGYKLTRFGIRPGEN